MQKVIYLKNHANQKENAKVQNTARLRKRWRIKWKQKENAKVQNTARLRKR